MKITFTEDELDSLPDDAREKLGDDLEIEVDTLSELSDTFEDVSGLKSALAKERKSHQDEKHARKSAEGKLAIAGDAEALAEKDAEIEKLKSDHAAEVESRDTEIKTLKDTALTGKIASAVSKAGGNVDLLTPHLRAALAENPDLDIDEHVEGMKGDETFSGAFKATSHSGGGGDPSHGNESTFGKSRLHAMPMRRSEMTDRQKVDYQKQHGLDALLSLPQ